MCSAFADFGGDVWRARHLSLLRRPRGLDEKWFVKRALRRFQFGDYTLDEQSWTLARGDEVIPLAPQPFRLLACLLRNHGRLVSKQELVDAAWPGLAISDSALASALHVARRAIGDDGREQSAIATYRKRGYRFIPPVHELPTVDNDREYEVF